MTADLSGRTALVTGASSGFGEHFCRVLARAGAEVVAMARRADRLQSLVAEIEASGGKARVAAADVVDKAQVDAVIDGLERLDIVVNNAGVAGKARAIDVDEAEWRWTFDVNVNGAWFVSQRSAQRMREAGRGGSIINIASITGFRPGAVATAYSSSKAAVVMMTQACALEWARFGIRVNALAPGYFETDLNREFLHSDFGQQMMKRVPQRRFGEMSELDGPLLLLASDASAYMTGAVIPVDGGHLVSVL